MVPRTSTTILATNAGRSRRAGSSRRLLSRLWLAIPGGGQVKLRAALTRLRLGGAVGRLRFNRWVAGVLAVVGLGLAWAIFEGTKGPSESSGDQVASKDVPPLPWEAPEEPTAPPPKDEQAPVESPPPAVKPPKGGPDSMPPASAGSNGSFKPRPASERERIEALTHPVGSADRAALLLGDTAIAPFSAPEEIQGAISAANQLVDQPYRWGGGHASFRSRGYDCSGAVSYALAGAGLLGAPATSGQLMGWGEPGRGRWLTIYANPSHVYAVIAGLRWDTVGDAQGSGPRWHPADAYPSGFRARHIPGL